MEDSRPHSYKLRLEGIVAQCRVFGQDISLWDSKEWTIWGTIDAPPANAPYECLPYRKLLYNALIAPCSLTHASGFP